MSESSRPLIAEFGSLKSCHVATTARGMCPLAMKAILDRTSTTTTSSRSSMASSSSVVTSIGCIGLSTFLAAGSRAGSRASQRNEFRRQRSRQGHLPLVDREGVRMVSLKSVASLQSLVRLVGQDMIPDLDLQFQPRNNVGRFWHPVCKTIVPTGQRGQPVVVQLHDHGLPEDPAPHRIGLILDHAAAPINHAELDGEVPVGIAGGQLVPGPRLDERQREGRRPARLRLRRVVGGAAPPRALSFLLGVAGPPPRVLPPPPPSPPRAPTPRPPRVVTT